MVLSAENALVKLKATTAKLTLYSEGGASQFQELINQWPLSVPNSSW